MKIVVKHKYPCDSQQVYELFCSDGFHTDKFAACGARKIKVIETEKSKKEFSITIEREVEANVPGVLKSFLGEWNAMTQTEEWQDVDDGEYICDFAIEADGVPVEISGTMNLMPDGDGSVNHVELEIDCAIPLVGKKLVKFVAADAEKSLAAEYDYISSRLEG